MSYSTTVSSSVPSLDWLLPGMPSASAKKQKDTINEKKGITEDGDER